MTDSLYQILLHGGRNPRRKRMPDCLTVVQRSYGSKATNGYNNISMTSVLILEAGALIPEYARGQAGERGGFEMRTFAVHMPYKSVSRQAFCFSLTDY